MQSGKALGPDGFTSAYHMTFCEVLLAHIMVLPKPGKNTTCCGSFQPISLLNPDLKLKTTSLLPPFPPCILSDQTGFIPVREAGDNSPRTLSLIAYMGKKIPVHPVVVYRH